MRRGKKMASGDVASATWFLQCHKKKHFLDPRERMASGGKVYLGSKIKGVPQCFISFPFLIENQSQKYSQCPEIRCHMSAVQHPASLACAPGCSPCSAAVSRLPPGACLWWPHGCEEKTCKCTRRSSVCVCVYWERGSEDYYTFWGYIFSNTWQYN